MLMAISILGHTDRMIRSAGYLHNLGGYSPSKTIMAAEPATPTRFSLDCSSPVSDGFFALHDLVDYLTSKVKVAKLRGNLKDKIAFEEVAAEKKVDVIASVKYSKRAVRYYARKFLKKHDLRERYRVISTSPSTYQFRPYRVSKDE
jgi:large subunit ribosomal protein L22e